METQNIVNNQLNQNIIDISSKSQTNLNNLNQSFGTQLERFKIDVNQQNINQ